MTATADFTVSTASRPLRDFRPLPSSASATAYRGSDFARMKRQQQFLGSVFRKATQSSNLLLNPIKVASLLAAVKDSLTLDQSTSITDLEKLAIHLRGVSTNQLVFDHAAHPRHHPVRHRPRPAQRQSQRPLADPQRSDASLSATSSWSSRVRSPRSWLKLKDEKPPAIPTSKAAGRPQDRHALR